MDRAKKIKLGSKQVGKDEPVFVVAEAGLTHFGDLKLAKKQVDVAIAAGCDAIKFQKRDISAMEDGYWRDRLAYKELTEEQMLELRDYCVDKNIEFFVTPHDEKSLIFLNEVLGIPFLKVGSGESMDFDFLKKVGSCKKPVIISFGLHLTNKEIVKSVKALEDGGTKEIILLHCNTVYPTSPEMVDLGLINQLKNLFDYPVGYSDHTVGWHIPLAAVVLGACLIEKHISFDKTDERSLDCVVSCEPKELKSMVKQIRDIEKAIKQPSLDKAKEIKKAREWVSKMTGKKF